MVRLIIAVIIIVAVLMLFSKAGPAGVGSGGGGARLLGGARGNSALVPGYRSEPPSGAPVNSPSA